MSRRLGVALTSVVVAVNLWSSNPVLAKSTDVTIVNGRAPFHRYTPVSIAPGFFQSVCPTALLTVPAGKTMVIEFMTLFGVNNIPTPGMFATVTTTAGGISVDYIFALAPAGANILGQPVYTATVSTKLYADGGTAVNACISRGSDVDGGGINFSVSGYLIDP